MEQRHLLVRMSLTAQISIHYLKNDSDSHHYLKYLGYGQCNGKIQNLPFRILYFKGKKPEVSNYLYNNSSTGYPPSLTGIPSYILGSCINQFCLGANARLGAWPLAAFTLTFQVRRSQLKSLGLTCTHCCIKIDHQQEPTLQEEEICSAFCDNLNRKRI